MYKDLVVHFPDFGGPSFYISLYKAQGSISSCCNSIHIGVSAEVVENVHPQVPDTGDCLQDLAMEYILSIGLYMHFIST